jgi:glyoxylate reductase
MSRSPKPSGDTTAAAATSATGRDGTAGPPPLSGHVYVSRHLGDAAMARLSGLARPIQVNPYPDNPPEREEFFTAAKGAVAVVTLLTESIDEAFFDAVGPQLRIVATVAVGTDNIDVEAAARRGVIVTNTPNVLTESTADLTLALLLAVNRRIVEADRFLRENEEWSWGPRFLLGRDLDGEVLGIVGYGRIGAAVARRARAFGMRVIATGRPAASAGGAAEGVEAVTLPTLLRTADVVSLHCPLTPETHHLIGAAELASMKPGSALINTARGPLVDEDALVVALRTGHIRAAGLDVFEHEPQVHPGLRELANVVVTPHIGSAGEQTRDRMAVLAVDNVMAVISGRPPLTPVVDCGVDRR